jgi:hypothetical protein
VWEKFMSRRIILTVTIAAALFGFVAAPALAQNRIRSPPLPPRS